MLAAIDNWIFVLLLAIAGLLRLLASKTAKYEAPSEDEPSSPRPRDQASRPVTTSDEEQIRKFLEALGQPTTSRPPPPVVPRTEIPPRPLAPVQPPTTVLPGRRSRGYRVAPKKTEDQPRQTWQPPETAERFQETVTTTARRAEVPVFEVREATTAPSEARAASQPEAYAIGGTPAQSRQKITDLRALLSSPSALRQAIILREIFGPPRSLQPLEEQAGFA